MGVAALPPNLGGRLMARAALLAPDERLAWRAVYPLQQLLELNPSKVTAVKLAGRRVIFDFWSQGLDRGGQESPVLPRKSNDVLAVLAGSGNGALPLPL